MFCLKYIWVFLFKIQDYLSFKLSIGLIIIFWFNLFFLCYISFLVQLNSLIFLYIIPIFLLCVSKIYFMDIYGISLIIYYVYMNYLVLVFDFSKKYFTCQNIFTNRIYVLIKHIKNINICHLSLN